MRKLKISRKYNCRTDNYILILISIFHTFFIQERRYFNITNEKNLGWRFHIFFRFILCTENLVKSTSMSFDSRINCARHFPVTVKLNKHYISSWYYWQMYDSNSATPPSLKQLLIKYIRNMPKKDLVNVKSFPRSSIFLEISENCYRTLYKRKWHRL